jgi:hypothetical protein
MKTIFKTAIIVGAAVSLAACTCPKKNTYDGGPYSDRTAGTGVSVWEGKCHVGGDRSSYAIEDERTAGEEMFDSSMRK